MANRVIYFVSEEKLKSFTSIHENVQVHDILPHINDAQNLFLQDLLGSNFFASLKDEIEADNLSAENRELVDDFIAPFVLNAALYQALPFQYVKFRNKGLLKGDSEEATGADLKDVQYIRDAVRTTFEFYRERLRKQLVNFSNLYPEYVTVTNMQNVLPNKRVDYSRGLAIPRTGSKTMNQQYGLPLENQGDYYNTTNTGCDGCEERYAPPTP
jgi:hypothetical protein